MNPVLSVGTNLPPRVLFEPFIENLAIAANDLSSIARARRPWLPPMQQVHKRFAPAREGSTAEPESDSGESACARTRRRDCGSLWSPWCSSCSLRSCCSFSIRRCIITDSITELTSSCVCASPRLSLRRAKTPYPEPTAAKMLDRESC